ncbi:MAG: alcohol dehydrogenase catalytic domain-containing protein, partial [Stellaceae bacterium]
GDLCSVPFNVACGTCRNCRERHTDVCLRASLGIISHSSSGEP